MSETKIKENIFNVPNLLSGYRLLAFPATLYLAIRGNERAFVILMRSMVSSPGRSTW